jgi:hypothetical protein
MNQNSIPTPPEPTEPEIQHTAYLLWLESGRVEGRDLDNWLAAKELLRHHHARASGHSKGRVSTIPPPIPVAPPKAAPAKATPSKPAKK